MAQNTFPVTAPRMSGWQIAAVILATAATLGLFALMVLHPGATTGVMVTVIGFLLSPLGWLVATIEAVAWFASTRSRRQLDGMVGMSGTGEHYSPAEHRAIHLENQRAASAQDVGDDQDDTNTPFYEDVTGDEDQVDEDVVPARPGARA